MFKKTLCLICGLSLLFTLSACGGADSNGPASAPESSQPTEQVNPYIINPLTGVADLDKDKANVRPVAIMVDNDSVAQTNTQSGISNADIVYETETEGGITRLMAVFQDISKVPQIGDVRSARYVYVDLAMGHNAIYVHSGKDVVFCGPHLNDLDNFEISYGYYGERIHYGSARNWQELFTTGETLIKGFTDKKWQTTQKNVSPWQTFAAEDKAVSLAGGVANKVTAAFNSSYISYFTYDPATGKYIKTSSKCNNTDRNDGSSYEFENVFVLKTTMGYYDGNYRRDIALDSGSGYYAVNGTYEEIKWKKGDSEDSLTFTRADGSPLTVSAGNSWVCFIKNEGKALFE